MTVVLIEMTDTEHAEFDSEPGGSVAVIPAFSS
jgi:hypothetical protein